jgi:NADH-ubiquinone oxidoreductase chain 6
MHVIYNIITGLLFGTSIFVVGSKNAIHSLLSLIFIFFLGTVLLFLLQLDYFALLFLIVYVGAIVVLFLFVVMMLKVKNTQGIKSLKQLVFYRNWLPLFLLILLLEFNNIDRISLNNFLSALVVDKNKIIFIDVLNYIEEVLFLNKNNMLTGLGIVLFTENKLSVILASLLLLLSMVGAIVITLSSNVFSTIKIQNLNVQFDVNYSKLNLQGVLLKNKE